MNDSTTETLAGIQAKRLRQTFEERDPGQWTADGYGGFEAFAVRVTVGPTGRPLIRHTDAHGEWVYIAVVASAPPETVAEAAIALRKLAEA